MPSHRTRDQMDENARIYYDQWKSDFLVEAGISNLDGSHMYRIAFGKDPSLRGTTVSEGQGYGMLIVSMKAGYDPESQAIEDGLWTFAREHPGEGDPRLMDWRVPEESGN